MDNQHRKITGYRELNQEEINLMNEIKALGPQIEAMIVKVQAHIKYQQEHTIIAAGPVAIPDQDLIDRLRDATPERFAALAKTDFQTALMYLTRAVAQPTFF